MFGCQTCGKIFQTGAQLNWHNKSHEKCKYGCGFEATPNVMKKHHALHPPPTLRSMKAHVRTKHPKVIAQLGSSTPKVPVTPLPSSTPTTPTTSALASSPHPTRSPIIPSSTIGATPMKLVGAMSSSPKRRKTHEESEPIPTGASLNAAESTQAQPLSAPMVTGTLAVTFAEATSPPLSPSLRAMLQKALPEPLSKRERCPHCQKKVTSTEKMAAHVKKHEDPNKVWPEKKRKLDAQRVRLIYFYLCLCVSSSLWRSFFLIKMLIFTGSRKASIA
jgi:hypothetical protein